MKTMNLKRFLSLALILVCLLACLPQAQAEGRQPKYVFLFIGDGMGSPQISATQYYLGTLQNPEALYPTPAALSFTSFPYVGIMTTYDATSFCPDSASTATSLASGYKTLSAVINYHVDLEGTSPLITEYAKQAGKKVGVVTSVSLDHATPAAFYARAESRSQYYEIGLQGVTGTTLDFLGGGSYLSPTGEEEDQPDLRDLARENGFHVADTNGEIRALGQDSGRILALAEDPDGRMSMRYELDRRRLAAEGKDYLPLKEMVEAAIRVLDQENGFFLMTEGGKIDWSNHANDGATAIHETLAFSEAVQVAIDFAASHPEETLIVVTGDHETGGMSIGFAATGYDTHFSNLQRQDMSFWDFSQAVAALREEKADFAKALTVIEQHYGLTLVPDQLLSLSPREIASLAAAYTLSMQAEEERQIGEAETLAYGGYEPLSMAVSHIMNNKAGLSYTSYSHTGLQLPVYAMGVGSEGFMGSYDNTDIFHKLMAAMGLKP